MFYGLIEMVLKESILRLGKLPKAFSGTDYILLLAKYSNVIELKGYFYRLFRHVI